MPPLCDNVDALVARVAVAALPEHDAAVVALVAFVALVAVVAVVAVAALPEHDAAVVAVAALPVHEPDEPVVFWFKVGTSPATIDAITTLVPLPRKY